MADSNFTTAVIEDEDTPDNAVKFLFNLWLLEKEKVSRALYEITKIESAICMMLTPDYEPGRDPIARRQQTAEKPAFPAKH